MSGVQIDYLRTTHHSISWIANTFKAGHLELAPPFQRKPVWTRVQQGLLIDTILQGYPIPEIYMQRSFDSGGNEHHAVVDGQQRLRACIEYIQGEYEIRTDPKSESAWEGYAYEDLVQEQRNKILAYQFVVRELPAVDHQIIRSIFKRLNQNTVALNPQELRQATYWGRFIVAATEIAELEYWQEFNIFTANAIRRMLDIEYVSELMILYLHGVQNKKQSLDKWYLAYEQQGFPEEADVRRGFDLVLREVSRLMPDLRKTRWRQRSDFYSLFGALSRIVHDLPFGDKDAKKLGRRLVSFAEMVDLDLGILGRIDASAPDKTIDAKEVSRYVKAVERAASDLSTRRVREEVILTSLGYEELG